MLDCGMHMGYNDDRRFPDFTYIAQGNVNKVMLTLSLYKVVFYSNDMNEDYPQTICKT